MKIRASYPNYHMVCRYAQCGPDVFNCDVDDVNNTLEGNKPGTVIYDLEDGSGEREFPPRWYDMYRLLNSNADEQKAFLRMLIDEHNGNATSHQLAELNSNRESFRKAIVTYVNAHPLYEDDELITPLTHRQLTDDEISYKGRMLLELTQSCYPVPDFVILTAQSFLHPEHLQDKLRLAIHNLEYMTDSRLDGDTNPLVFAIRCAMPQYIPGLMPTLLNVGVTHKVHKALAKIYDSHMANRIYLSTLHSLCQMLSVEHTFDVSDIGIDTKEQERRIATLEQRITNAREDGKRLLHDADHQVLQLVKHVLGFYHNNQDLVLTFMQGKQASPSLILQRMVWTVGNNESYAGVLYSRNSRTGVGRQIESHRNIFGEEIMTGDVVSDDCSYHNRDAIKQAFPAVYHFDPLLIKLESRHHSPVTIEFAVESRPNRLSLFSVLQLNMSELTGPAALISAIDLLNNGHIQEKDVMNIIKPYHLRQIVSATIDDKSMKKLQPFGKGLSVLPHSAVSAVLCFSIGKAREMAAKGNQVCLCQNQFVPQDTITLNEVQAILSMKPAAIHVVTACRGFGIPALLDLNNYGIQLKTHNSQFTIHNSQFTLHNSQGLVLHELDHITISSKEGTIYKGVADFKPARFTKYLRGEQVKLDEQEKTLFDQMRLAYIRYQEITTNSQAVAIDNVDNLARLIRLELQDKPETAKKLVNNWYNGHVDLYVHQVLESKMGSHQDQSRVFNLLSIQNKIIFFQMVSDICIRDNRYGLKAGSFMLGRFTAKPLPTAVWNALTEQQVAFLLNEYVLYEKYLVILQEVGEIKLARAHSRIETEGIDNTMVSQFDLYTFIPLLYSQHNIGNLNTALQTIEHQDNTHLLIEKLSKPIEEIFDTTQTWVVKKIESMKSLL